MAEAASSTFAQIQHQIKNHSTFALRGWTTPETGPIHMLEAGSKQKIFVDSIPVDYQNSSTSRCDTCSGNGFSEYARNISSSFSASSQLTIQFADKFSLGIQSVFEHQTNLRSSVSDSCSLSSKFVTVQKQQIVAKLTLDFQGVVMSGAARDHMIPSVRQRFDNAETDNDIKQVFESYGLFFAESVSFGCMILFSSSFDRTEEEKIEEFAIEIENIMRLSEARFQSTVRSSEASPRVTGRSSNRANHFAVGGDPGLLAAEGELAWQQTASTNPCPIGAKFFPTYCLAASAKRDQFQRVWDSICPGDPEVAFSIPIHHTVWRLPVSFEPRAMGYESVAWHGSGGLASSFGSNVLVQKFDHESPTILPGHRRTVTTVAWSRGGRLASGGNDNSVRLWSAGENPPRLKHVLGPQSLWSNGHTSSVRSVAWSPNQNYVASGSKDKRILVWDAHTGLLISSLNEHDGFVNSVQWYNDAILASGSDDRTVRIWEKADNRIAILDVKRVDAEVNSIAWSPNGNILALGCNDGVLRLWTWRPRAADSLQELRGHRERINSVAWRASGDRFEIATGSNDKTVRLWRLDRPGRPVVLTGHNGFVQGVCWTDDGRLVSCSEEGIGKPQLLVWDTHLA